MQVSHSYYEDEVRDGFYVSGMMKRAWAASIEVLEDIMKICKKHDIRFFADAGTLLGAIRHRGFIPWDDDLDICMLREDYARFVRVAKEELPKGYSLLDVHTDLEYEEIFPRVVNRRTISFMEEDLKKFHDFPFVVGIDIFFLDYVAVNEEEENVRRQLAKMVYHTIKAFATETDAAKLEKRIRQVEEGCKVSIDRKKNIKRQLLYVLEDLFTMYHADGATELAFMPSWIEGDSNKFKIEYYEKAIEVDFEKIKIPVPAMYDAVLRKKYGDYITPVHNWEFHDYPVYKKQMEFLEKHTNVKYPKYSISMEILGEKQRRGKQDKVQKEVVFLPYKPETWEGMESVWEAAQADENCTVYVIPIPYFEKNALGQNGKMHYEKEGYPDYVKITGYREYDFVAHHPDIVFINIPYDAYNPVISIHPFFYSKNLRKFTDNLVYIPSFVLDEIEPKNKRAVASLEHFVLMPGVVHADKVIVQSEQMRQVYIDTLVKAAGESSRHIWEEKIVGWGSPKYDRRPEDKRENIILPEEWKNKIQKTDGSCKKIILYYTSISAVLEHGEKMLQKIQYVFGVFQEKQEDIVIWWKPDTRMQTVMKAMRPKLWEKYQEIVRKYKEEQWGIYDDTEDLERAISVSDAYYGDMDYVVKLCKESGKPVMIQNVDILE